MNKKEMPAPVVVEPVAWAATSEEGIVEALGMNQSRRFDTPLYTHPAPAQQPECYHDETERLGIIWTRCTQCGKMWADDEIKETP